MSDASDEFFRADEAYPEEWPTGPFTTYSPRKVACQNGMFVESYFTCCWLNYLRCSVGCGFECRAVHLPRESLPQSWKFFTARFSQTVRLCRRAAASWRTSSFLQKAKRTWLRPASGSS